MANVPAVTRFIGFSEIANLTERKTDFLNSISEPYTMADIAKSASTAKLVTYAELSDLIVLDGLIPGAFYLISDYQTVYDQPDYNADGTPKTEVETYTGPVEPLIVFAASINGLARQAWSTVYTTDIIMYDVNFTQTEVMGAPAKGRMLQRTTDANNTIGYDSRVVLLKRYSNPITELYTEVKDNGMSSIELPTFGAGCDNVNVWYIREEEAGFDDPVFIISNNVFGENCEEVVCGQDFYNNTIGDFCYGTTFNHWCHDNVLGSNFSNNTIANEFSFNVIGNDATTNQIQNSFQGNTIGTNFFSNSIGNNFGVGDGNIIGDGCFSNVIEDEFIGNTIGTQFQHNYISDYFQNATLTDNFQQNHVKVNCNGTELFDGTKAYDTSYTEVIDGFDAGGVAQPQRYIGWFDTSLGQFSYAGL
jgi:hypothetical protein